MSEYRIDKSKNQIIYDGESFEIAEIKSLLKRNNAEMYKVISCPGEIKYVLTEEALFVLRQKKDEKK